MNATDRLREKAQSEQTFFALRELFRLEKEKVAELEAALAAATVVPMEVVRSAEVLRDWLLPHGHPEKGMAGINPIALSAEELTYKSRDEYAMQLCNFILSLAAKGKEGGK